MRYAIEGIERRKDAMIGALWSNPNWDDDKETRANAIHEIEENYREAIMIATGQKKVEVEAELDETNPFLAPAIKATRELDDHSNGINGKVGASITAKDLKGLDQ